MCIDGWDGEVRLDYFMAKGFAISEHVVGCCYRSSAETLIDRVQNWIILRDQFQACDSRSSRKKTEVKSGVPTLVVPSLAVGKSLDTGTLLLILLGVSE